MASGARGARLGAVLAGVALMAGAGAWWWQARSAAAVEATAAAGLYALSLPDADGHPQVLSQWKGKVLVVNFWATWCAPCVAEMPDLDRLQQEYATRNVQVVGIGAEDADTVRAFGKRLGLHLTLLAGGYDALALARSVGDQQGVLPYTALFSSDGQLLQAHSGALAKDELRQWLAAAH
jgi:thiol-disulfide isomerase/thioredoxin